jgi:hypothetical protein
VKSRIFVKLLLAALVVIAACTISFDLLIGHAWESMLRSEIETSLRQKTLMFATRVADAPASSLNQITSQAAAASGTRITVIDKSGRSSPTARPHQTRWRITPPGPSLPLLCKGK